MFENINIYLIIFFEIIIYLYIATLLYATAFSLKIKSPWKAYIPILNVFYIPEVAGHKKGGWLIFGYVLFAVLASVLVGILDFNYIVYEYVVHFFNFGMFLIFQIFLVFWFWKIFNRKKYSGITSLFLLGTMTPIYIINLICVILFLISYSIIAFSNKK
jgi:hypothetical protein